jgi:replication-associated recombination protein RarA
VRYAVTNLIPEELLKQEVKIDNPGYSEKIVYQKYNHEIISYLEKQLEISDSIINISQLIRMIKNGETTDFIFRALNIIIFEELIKNKFGIKIKA